MKKSFKIYQLPVQHDAKFMGYDFAKENNLVLSLDNYNFIWEGEFEVLSDKVVYSYLDYIYMKFQGAKPEGYTGHSLSTSDVVELDGKFYYCDSFGWKQLNWSTPAEGQKHEVTCDAENVHFAQNGELLYGNGSIGSWEKEVIGGHDRSGNKLIPFMYWIEITSMPHPRGKRGFYSRKEVKEWLNGKKVVATFNQ
jgi:hypothetical protein